MPTCKLNTQRLHTSVDCQIRSLHNQCTAYGAKWLFDYMQNNQIPFTFHCLLSCRKHKERQHWTYVFNRCSKLILIQKQYLPAMYGKREKNGEREREGVLGWGERLSLVLTKANHKLMMHQHISVDRSTLIPVRLKLKTFNILVLWVYC